MDIFSIKWIQEVQWDFDFNLSDAFEGFRSEIKELIHGGKVWLDEKAVAKCG